MTFPTLTPPPTAPDQNDPSTFRARADAFVAWWATNNTEMSAWTALANALTGVTGTFQFLDGSAPTPAIAFAADLDTGIHRPGNNTLAFDTAGVEGLRVTSAQAVLASGGGGLGYADGLGVGATVTQVTSRTTGVTINNLCGQITLFSAAGSATPASFTVTNSKMTAKDIPELAIRSGTNKYAAVVTATAGGSFEITFWSLSGTATDAPVINFAIQKSGNS